jgi:hypothetical protein
MRNYRALLLAIAALVVLVIGLLFALLNRHSTINVVVSNGRFVGGSAKAGDTLTFSTSQASDPGYTVEFTGASPCADNANDLPVTWNNPASCSLVASNGSQVSYVYVIKRNNPPPNSGPHINTVIPCRLCFFNSGSDGGGSGKGQTRSATQLSDNTLVPIGCSANKGAPGVPSTPAEITNDGSAIVAWQSADSDGIWTLKFRDPDPCTTNTFSSGGSTTCYINPNTAPASYTYDWSVTCNGKAVTGPGTVKVDALP